ncbi:DUF1752-domain-containing protein [Morchella conica CCBAS932]|uniref:DUF1752-domain-containing protein n=1 Tax=Morchella conica CCBAS932 TaxID=1392247 RepID=A0A3N4L1Y6_9PEZI|nr:DUF1752-domain-containing protein [Morchella conica CCBAS932]
MPSRLSSPMLSLDINHIAKVDPRNVDNLFSMWTIFSKCAESLENGRRLENLSWRVWNRETFCCEETAVTVAPIKPTATAAPTATIPRKPRRQDSDTYSDVPELSSSVESAASDYELRSDAVNIKSSRSCLLRTDSAERYRGREKHMTPVCLVKLMEDLDKSKSSADDWISKRPLVISTEVEEAAQETMPEQSMCSPALPAAHSTPVGSASSYSTSVSAHSVVRGFTPGQNISVSIRSNRSNACLPSEPAAPTKKMSPAPKKATKKSMFFIGSSNSSAYDDESDSEDSFTQDPPMRKSKLSEGLKRTSGKRTSFRQEVATRTFKDDDVYTEDEEVISESAIDEDSSDWESSTDDSAHSSYNPDTMFQRVESRQMLTSRRSLLSTMLHEPKRAAALTNAGSRSTPALRSRTTSPSGPSLAPSLQRESPLTAKPTAEITRAKPIIMTTSNMHPPALSPRTTRRNMLATELTESLRRHLLWERQQKNTTAAAVLKRRHTAHDVTKLNDFPQVNEYSSKAASSTKASASKGNASKNNSWNHYFDQGLHEYHVAGW